MAWETRKNGRRYFYRSKRVKGRVEKVYFGCGFQAEMAAELFEAAKEKRQVNRERLNAAKAGLKLIPRQMEQLRRAPLDAANQSAHQRGESDSPPPLLTPETVMVRAQALLEAYRSGDRNAEVQLTELIDRYPGLMHRMGDVASLARANWVSLIVGKDDVFRAATVKKLEHMRSQYPVNDDPVRQLLVERILATWLQLNYLEAKMAAVRTEDMKNFEYLSRLQQKAQKQHFEAIQFWQQWQTNQELKN